MQIISVFRELEVSWLSLGQVWGQVLLNKTGSTYDKQIQLEQDVEPH